MSGPEPKPDGRRDERHGTLPDQREQPLSLPAASVPGEERKEEIGSGLLSEQRPAVNAEDLAKLAVEQDLQNQVPGNSNAAVEPVVQTRRITEAPPGIQGGENLPAAGASLIGTNEAAVSQRIGAEAARVLPLSERDASSQLAAVNLSHTVRTEQLQVSAIEESKHPEGVEEQSPTRANAGLASNSRKNFSSFAGGAGDFEAHNASMM